jgi:hypothetical protein
VGSVDTLRVESQLLLGYWYYVWNEDILLNKVGTLLINKVSILILTTEASGAKAIDNTRNLESQKRYN